MNLTHFHVTKIQEKHQNLNNCLWQDFFKPDGDTTTLKMTKCILIREKCICSNGRSHSNDEYYTLYRQKFQYKEDTLEMYLVKHGRCRFCYKVRQHRLQVACHTCIGIAYPWEFELKCWKIGVLWRIPTARSLYTNTFIVRSDNVGTCAWYKWCDRRYGCLGLNCLATLPWGYVVYKQELNQRSIDITKKWPCPIKHNLKLKISFLHRSSHN